MKRFHAEITMTTQRISARKLLIAALMTFCLSSCGVMSPKSPPRQEPFVAPEGVAGWGQLSTTSLAASDGHVGEVLAVRETSSNPAQVTSVGADGTVIVWDLSEGTGHIASSLGTPAQLSVFGGSKALVAWSSGLTITVACVTGCSTRWTLTRLKSRATSLAFHDEDTALLIGGADGRVYRWRFLKEDETLALKEREKILERYIAHQTMVSTVLSLHTGRAFFSGDWDGALYGWLAYTADDQQGDFDKNLFGGRFFGGIGNYLRAARPTDRGITSLALSSDGKQLAVGTDDGFVELWKVRGFEMVARGGLHKGRVTSVSLNADGSRILSAGRDGRVVATTVVQDPLYRIQANTLPNKLEELHLEEIPNAKGVYFLSSGNGIVTTSDGHLAELVIAQKKSLSRAPAQPTRPAAIASPIANSDY